MSQLTRAGCFLCICLFAGLSCLLRPPALAQAKPGAESSALPPTSQMTIRVKSNLVVIPVFVYDKTRSKRLLETQLKCAMSNQAAFRSVSVSAPYLPMDCNDSALRGLTAKSFRLYQDDVQQNIQYVSEEGWWRAVRDNRSWHVETSDTPSGIWSSTDLGGSGLQPGWRSDFYNLAFVPPASPAGGCHKITVKMNQPGKLIYARDQYCTGQTPSDILFGTDVAEQLERHMTTSRPGEIPVTAQAVAFHSGSQSARVDVSVHFPWSGLKHSWSLINFALQARISILGVVSRKNGTIVARFSDLLYPSYWPTSVLDQAETQHYLAVTQNFLAIRRLLESHTAGWLPTRYETQFEASPGEYVIDVIVSDGTNYGTVETPLKVTNHDGKELALAGIAVCKRFRDASVAAQEASAANFAPQYVPLVSKNVEFAPAGDTGFASGQELIAYFEIYEPFLARQPQTAVQVQMRIVGKSTSNIIEDLPPVDAGPYERPGSTAISVARKIALAHLARGAYQLEVRAADSAGHSTPWHSASFTVE